MDRVTTAITIVSIIAARAFALLGLWLRRRWYTRHERARRQCLLGFAQVVAAGGQMELDDQCGDGRRLRVRLTCAPAQRMDSAA